MFAKAARQQQQLQLPHEALRCVAALAIMVIEVDFGQRHNLMKPVGVGDR